MSSHRHRPHANSSVNLAAVEKRLLDSAVAIQDALRIVRLATTTPTASDSRLARLEQQVASLQTASAALQLKIDAFDRVLDTLSHDLDDVKTEVLCNCMDVDDLWDQLGVRSEHVEVTQTDLSSDDDGRSPDHGSAAHLQLCSIVGRRPQKDV